MTDTKFSRKLALLFLLLLFSFSAPGVFAQTFSVNAPKGITFLEALKGFRAGLDAEIHNYADRNLRSVCVIPNLYYEKGIQNFSMFFDLDIPVDIGAPDPALDAAREDRTVWNSIYLEENFDYFIPILEIAKFSFMLNNQNNIYAYPIFPEPLSIPADGRMYLGFQYTHFLPFGDMYVRTGPTLDYLSRSTDDSLGMGIENMIGWTDGFGIGLTAEFFFSAAFLPDAKYTDTELLIGYTYRKLGMELDITSNEFKSWSLGLEFLYPIKQITFKLGLRFDRLGQDPVSGEATEAEFTPCIGFYWNF